VPADRILLHSQARTNDSISKFTVGPTLCGNVRTGTGAFDTAERWCAGNLAGTAYSSSSVTARYGFAGGNASAAWVDMTAADGFRALYGNTLKFGVNTSGVASFVEGAVTIDNLGIRVHNTASSTGEATSYSFTGALTYTKRPLLGYYEGGGAGVIALSGGDRASGFAHVLVESAVGNIYLSPTGGSVIINGTSTLTTTVVVPCGTLTFNNGLLTNKGTC
jgi:hypothetical protein